MADASSKQLQHVVAVPVPAQGHLNPLMRFCKVLASCGFFVTFVNIDPVHHRIQAIQKRHTEDDEPAATPSGAREEDNLQMAHIPVSGLDLASDFRISFQAFYGILEGIVPQLELLIHQLNGQGPPVTCILSDRSMTLPTQDVADKLNIPRVAFLPAGASLHLLMYYVALGEHISITKVMEALTRGAETREVTCEGLPGLPTIYNDDLPACKHLVDENLYLWKFVTKTTQESFRRARAIVINSFEDLEAQAFTALSKQLSVPIYGVGPLVEPLHKQNSTSLWKEDNACILWLDQQPALSVLYISFGSITLLPQPQFEEIVAGLLTSQQRFLWVFRPDLVENSQNSAAFVSDVLARAHGKGYVVHWAPQLQVLEHPSVGGFLTHCGWNSTMEAIANGVPMICWPYFADQMLNAKYVVEEWKVGLRCEASSKEGGNGRWVKRGEVERVVRALMQGDEGGAARKNVLRLKEAGLQSLEAGGSSHSNMQALITLLNNM